MIQQVYDVGEEEKIYIVMIFEVAFSTLPPFWSKILHTALPSCDPYDLI